MKDLDICINEATFREILGKYKEKPFFVGMDGGDLEYIFDLVEDLLAAERDAVKVSEPYAHNTIDRLDTARREVFRMGLDIGDASEEVFC